MVLFSGLHEALERAIVQRTRDYQKRVCVLCGVERFTRL